MESLDSPRATRRRPALACLICRHRKKRCDRARPQCGYCVRTGLRCEYYAFPDTPSGRSTASPPDTQLKPISLPSKLVLEPPVRDDEVACFRLGQYGRLSDKLPALPNKPLIPSTVTAEPDASYALDEYVYDQVHSLIQTTRRFTDEIIATFFDDINYLIPVVSRPLFQDELLQTRNRHRADFSLLVLSMHLITYRPPELSEEKDRFHELYVSTKTLLAHVQTETPVSTRLIQAGLLISLYEYMRCLVDTALMTISLCARMAIAANLHKPKWAPPRPTSDTNSWLRTEEENNIWWIIVLLERLYVCETDSPDQPLISTIPPSGSHLPVKALEMDLSPHSIILSSPTASQIKDSAPGPFGKHGQATILLDRALQIVRIEDKGVLGSEITALDNELQDLLHSQIVSLQGSRPRECGSIAVTLRALFALHTSVLDWWSKNKPASFALGSQAQAALLSLSRISADIATFRGAWVTKQTFDRHPPFTLFILRQAMKYLNDLNPADERSVVEQRKSLSHALAQFAWRWRHGRTGGSVSL